MKGRLIMGKIAAAKFQAVTVKKVFSICSLLILNSAESSEKIVVIEVAFKLESQSDSEDQLESYPVRNVLVMLAGGLKLGGPSHSTCYAHNPPFLRQGEVEASIVRLIWYS